MTLVIAGVIDRETAFFCADSTISTNGRTLLSGFRKIYSVPVKTWEPSFVGDYFNDYLHEHTSTNCVVAFAGNTLTAQHLLNSISSHLSQLRISWCSHEGGYVLKRHCDRSNELFKSGRMWSDGMFLSQDFEGLITCEAVLETILYSVNEAIASARKYKLDEQGYNSLKTAFLAAAYDPERRETRLARFDFRSDVDEGGCLLPSFTKTFVATGDVALIGEPRLVAGYPESDLAAERGSKIDSAGFEYLLQKIDAAIDNNTPVVDYPAVLKHFQSGALKVVEHVPRRRQNGSADRS